MDKNYELLSFLIQGVKSILSNESNLFTIRGISDSGKNEESNIYTMFSEALLASTWNVVSSETISRCIFRIINEKVSADKQLHSLAIDKIPGTEKIKVPKNYILLRISFTTVTVKQILKEKPKMIEEKDVVALVKFKAQTDVPNGTTFLRAVDPVFGSLFKNGTVVTGLLKQRSRVVGSSSDPGLSVLDKNFDSVTEPIKNLCYSKALMMVKKGHRIYRESWNGANQWVRYVNPYAPHPDIVEGRLNIDVTTLNPYFKAADNNPMAEGTMVPWLGIKTSNNAFIPWLPTQTDNLAEDWVVLPK